MTNSGPPLRPCPQYIRLTFFVATTNQYLIQKSLKNAEIAIEHFNEIASFWGQLTKTLQNNLEFYLMKRNNFSFLLDNKELSGLLDERIKQLREYFLKENAIRVYTSYYTFNRLYLTSFSPLKIVSAQCLLFYWSAWEIWEESTSTSFWSSV
jgi:hypothetical protein